MFQKFDADFGGSRKPSKKLLPRLHDPASSVLHRVVDLLQQSKGQTENSANSEGHGSRNPKRTVPVVEAGK
jgi:hypothetical protein